MPHSASRGHAVGNGNPDNPLTVAAHMSVNEDAKTTLGLITTRDESESRLSVLDHTTVTVYFYCIVQVANPHAVRTISRTS